MVRKEIDKVQTNLKTTKQAKFKGIYLTGRGDIFHLSSQKDRNRLRQRQFRSPFSQSETDISTRETDSEGPTHSVSFFRSRMGQLAVPERGPQEGTGILISKKKNTKINRKRKIKIKYRLQEQDKESEKENLNCNFLLGYPDNKVVNLLFLSPERATSTGSK